MRLQFEFNSRKYHFRFIITDGGSFYFLADDFLGNKDGYKIFRKELV